MTTFRIVAPALALGLALAIPAAAQAQDPYAPAHQPVQNVRSGLIFGFGIGGGELSCEDVSSEGDGPCDGVTEAGSFDVHLGGMLTPRLALMGDLWVMGHTEDFLTVSQTISTAAVQYWVLPRVWVKAGLGGAHARFSYNGPFVNVTDRSQTVPAAMIGAGIELLAKKSFAMDLQFKAGTGFYKDDDTKAHNASLTLGFNWY